MLPVRVAGLLPDGVSVIDQVPASLVICKVDKSVVPASLHSTSGAEVAVEGQAQSSIKTSIS